MKTIAIFLFLISGCLFITAQTFIDQKPFKQFKKQTGAIEALAFQSDGKVLASGSEDKTCVLFSFPDGQVLKTLTGFLGPVRAIFYTPNDKFLCVGGDRTVKIYKTTGDYINTYTGPATYIWSLSFNQDLNQIVCGSYDKNLRIIDFASGKISYSLMGHLKNALAVAYSPNGKLIASGSLDQTIKLWDTQTKKETLTLKGHGGNIYAVLFSSNSDLLFSASNDNSIRVWDIKTGETIHHLMGHEKGISSIALSPDQNYLISGSYDGTVRLWDWLNEECIGTFDHQASDVNTVTFNPEGTMFASGTSDNTIRIWELKPEIFVDHYYEKELKSEIGQSSLFQPKGKDENKSDYKLRQEKANNFRNTLIQKYYKLYQTEIKGKVRPKM